MTEQAPVAQTTEMAPPEPLIRMTDTQEVSDLGNILGIMSLKRLQAKVGQSQRNADIFWTQQELEDESAKVVPPPTNPIDDLVRSFIPGVSPNTIYLGALALAMVFYFRR
jgi:hypothetical protein